MEGWGQRTTLLLLSQTLEAHGKIDILTNNAGANSLGLVRFSPYSLDGMPILQLADVTPRAWQLTLLCYLLLLVRHSTSQSIHPRASREPPRPLLSHASSPSPLQVSTQRLRPQHCLASRHRDHPVQHRLLHKQSKAALINLTACVRLIASTQPTRPAGQEHNTPPPQSPPSPPPPLAPLSPAPSTPSTMIPPTSTG